MEEGSNHKKNNPKKQVSQDMTLGEKAWKELKEKSPNYSRAGQVSIMFGIKPPKGWNPSKDKSKSKDQNN